MRSPKYVAVILSAWIVMLMSGCAYEQVIRGDKINEGITDYRVILPNELNKTQSKKSQQSGEITQNLHDRFLKGSELGKATLKKDDSITITMQQGFMADFFEFGEQASGEIAVVARAQELKGDTNISFTKKAAESGRVVYYSDNVIKGGDLHKGQYLNFSAMPLYGPIKYNGGPIFIELYIIEMDDKESQQYRELLKTLASIGSTAYPPASPVLGVLDSIGSALLSGAQNDIEFRYHFTLWPYDSEKSEFEFRQAYLHEGNLVFVKQDHPRKTRISEKKSPAQQPVNWQDLRFDPKNGRLVYSKDIKDSKGEKLLQKSGANYEKHTYLTLRISKREDSSAADIANKYFSLGDLINNMISDEGDMIAVKKSLDELAEMVDKVNKEDNK